MASNHDMKVALIGCGIMGAPIGGHILDAGFDLTVCNRTKEKADDLVAHGAHWADTPAEAAKAADVILTMVGYPSDVEDVYLSTDGLIRTARKGAWLVDLTTSSPQLARDIHDAAEVEDKHAVDIPVTGGESGAKAGTLTLMVGATAEDVAPIMPVLETFSDKVFCFGGAGCGQTAKLCNQVSLASCMVGMADAVALADQGGLDVNTVLDMIGGGMGSSRAVTELGPKVADGDWKPGFLAEHMRKDIALALAQSEDLDITLPGAENAFALYDMLCQIGGSRLGTQALALLYADEGEATAAGLDWSLLDMDDYAEEADDDSCGCGHDHEGHGHGGHDHDGCTCGHDHHDGGCGCGKHEA
ncbi:MAG: NAD(P)-dependent oxidoreductase [Atopobiaceae bacterium]|jgi:3-hydroxyisobutyrate dehydrogenase|nr:NAD(P)-dependent oxidoreductase [Atopobiaceae bacterium]MCI2174010.1 NAD(P)-dependent oxidoreductase [Atopobiaceae bacterium]MCI2207900.1 NAD(P)-dependent oxidoreductase [Atopobiaceae bacterium]